MKEEGTVPAQAGGDTGVSLWPGARREKGLQGWRLVPTRTLTPPAPSWGMGRGSGEEGKRR